MKDHLLDPLFISKEKGNHLIWLHNQIISGYGLPCKEDEPGCATCDAWFLYNEIAKESDIVRN